MLLGPILPPGNGSDQASGHVTDNTVLLAMATPVLLLVVIYLHLRGDLLPPAEAAARSKGPAMRGDARIQTTWIVVTSVLVLALAAYGTVRLDGATARARGSGPDAADGAERAEAARAGDRPAVGVHLPLPDLRRRRDAAPRPAGQRDDRTPRHLARRDPLLLGLPAGVKADANPGVDNVAFVKPTKLETFEVRCAELCGIWHG